MTRAGGFWAIRPLGVSLVLLITTGGIPANEWRAGGFLSRPPAAFPAAAYVSSWGQWRARWCSRAHMVASNTSRKPPCTHSARPNPRRRSGARLARHQGPGPQVEAGHHVGGIEARVQQKQVFR